MGLIDHPVSAAKAAEGEARFGAIGVATLPTNRVDMRNLSVSLLATFSDDITGDWHVGQPHTVPPPHLYSTATF